MGLEGGIGGWGLWVGLVGGLKMGLVGGLEVRLDGIDVGEAVHVGCSREWQVSPCLVLLTDVAHF